MIESNEIPPYERKVVLRFELEDESEWMITYATETEMGIDGLSFACTLTMLRDPRGRGRSWYLDDDSRKRLHTVMSFMDPAGVPPRRAVLRASSVTSPRTRPPSSF